MKQICCVPLLLIIKYKNILLDIPLLKENKIKILKKKCVKISYLVIYWFTGNKNVFISVNRNNLNLARCSLYKGIVSNLLKENCLVVYQIINVFLRDVLRCWNKNMLYLTVCLYTAPYICQQNKFSFIKKVIYRFSEHCRTQSL